MAPMARVAQLIVAASTAAFSLCAGPGCGTDDDAVSSTTAGSAGVGGTGGTGATGASGGTAGVATGGSSGTSAGGNSGTSTGGSVGSTDAGATGAGACASGWTAGEELMRVADGGWITSPTLSPDELEVIYGYSNIGGISQIRRSVRDALDAPFRPGEIVAELEPRCDMGTGVLSIDLSADGLTAYMVCYIRPPLTTTAVVWIARRPRIGAAFTVDPEAYGQAGGWASVGADELVMYGTICGESPTGVVCSLMMFPRPTKSDRFVTGRVVPGLETGGLSSPDPSVDDLWLFGAFEGNIVVAGRERRDARFGAPSVAIAGDWQQGGAMLTDPEVSRDCRRLYYIHREPGVSGGGIQTLRVARR